MTPARAIAMLDRQIEKHGQEVLLRRRVPNGPVIELTVRAVVRDYKADELVGGISQGDSLVTLSPTSLAGTPFAAELPDMNDRVTVDEAVRNVVGPVPVRVAGVLVRLNLQVRGS